MSSPRRPRCTKAALLAGVVACLAGCGHGPGSGEGWLSERIALRPTVPYGPRSSTVVAVMAVPEQIAPWVVTAALTSIEQIEAPPGRATEPTLRAVCLQEEGLEGKEVRIPGRFDPSSFNQVAVVARALGRAERLRIDLRSGGQSLEASGWKTIHPENPTGVYLFDLSGIRRLEDPFDELVVQFHGGGGRAAVCEVDLLLRPAHTFLPPHAEAHEPVAPELVPIGGDWRRGYGLSTEHPLAGEIEVRAGTQLAFSHGVFQPLRTWEDRLALTLVLESEGGERLLTRTYLLERKFPARARWHEEQVDLGAYRGQRVRVRFELTTRRNHEGFCIVAEPTQRSFPPRGGDATAPSVLLVTSDTHRGDHLGAAGAAAPVRTPNLDALAARGVLFEDCLASTNITNPSHVSLMTAVHPRDTRIVNNRTPLGATATTLAEHFAAAGYRTFAAVSAHHLVHPESGLGQGFDRMDGPESGARSAADTLAVLEQWLKRAEGEPLFVWLHVFDAHAPYDPPEPFDGRYYPTDRDPYDPAIEPGVALPDEVFPDHLRRDGRTLRDLDFPYQQYRGEIDYLDSQLAPLLERPRFRAGIVAFTADHGESFGQHGVYWDHAGLHPGNVHVPLILAWPGAPAGTRTQEPVRQIDVGRTLLDLAGIEARDLGGRDLRWVLETEPVRDARFLLSAHAFSAAVSSGRWFLILQLRPQSSQPMVAPREEYRVALYDRAADPSCERDLVDAEPETARRLREQLIGWIERAETTGLGFSPELSPEAEASLAALGYAQVDAPGEWWEPERYPDAKAWLQRFE